MICYLIDRMDFCLLICRIKNILLIFHLII
uniref:Uncharacterized protein n=1 Tax=Podoviridae sp. ctZkC8 TaxID=2825259 RepID=A0A8S5UCD9_9CAUD|nr:MAG TPA: hypothetical protein [Podoviridae sp. ctZkC8]